MSENEQDKRLEETAGEEPAKEEKSGREAYEWVQALVCSVLAVVVLFTFVIRLIGVDGHSMVPTLQDGDRLLVTTSLLSGEYRYGDIVIIQKGTFADGDPIVKRVIATEGQTVDIDFANGIVYVDGEALDEPYINEPTYTDEGTEFPLTVPEGSIFVMGDNRNRSDDSRNAELGTVDTRYVIGRAVFLLFPGADEATGKRNFGRIGLIGGVEA
ncbi:signal peptidase I [Dysosmobacter sp.]|uniref:signal peptidase I n=1 Tax=Dysosmobacter sp. TaxID=2591382 RepID=UPI002A993090|nr:signal peptidase I [Dysosmobacter sp.]MCI6054645.1 signal peptidase I [Dysosmobacter sp.]MDY5510100.1 signal peptidase I [Dysosmobacter sp.]